MHPKSEVKYTTRSFMLLGDQQRNLACAAIQNAPVGIECILREPVKARGLDQNGLYFLRLGEIARDGWFNERLYSKETWHHYAGIHLMPEMITTKDGEVRSKWEESPDGSMAVISTTKLERRCFSEYITIVEAFGANLGVHHSANPNEVGR